MATKSIEKAPTKKKLTKAEQRVEIARDVIAQLKVQKFVAQCGIYASIFGEGLPLEDTQAVVREATKCAVCARGSLVLAAIDKFNNLKIDRRSHYWSSAQSVVEREAMSGRYEDAYINRFFSGKQLGLMEDIFEGNRIGFNEEDWSKEWRKVYPNQTDRLEAIMRNVIANGGIFDISRIPRKPAVPFSARIRLAAKKAKQLVAAKRAAKTGVKRAVAR